MIVRPAMSTPTAPAASRCVLFEAAELESVLDTMAARMAAGWGPTRPLALLGLLRRGAPLAERLAQRLVQHHGLPPPLRLDLDVKRYADDLRLLYPDTHLGEHEGLRGLDLSQHRVWLVDDVLYTGHSLLRVLGHLAAWHPAELRVAVWVDRCVARLPLHADVVGLHLQMGAQSVVDCQVPPYEPALRIDGVRPAAEPEPEAQPGRAATRAPSLSAGGG